MKPLYFKNNESAFEIACRLMVNDLSEGVTLPALVLDAKQLGPFQNHSVIVKPDGNQLVFLKVASNDGGFVIPTETAGAKGPKLEPGDLVAWRAIEYFEDIGEHAKINDKRFGWIGFVVAKLKPEFRDEGWAIEQTFSP